MKRFRKAWIGLALLVPLAGCKSEIYSNLPERDANEMVTVLAGASIGAERRANKDGSFNVLVEGSSIAQATQVLSARGLPRAKFESLGNVFRSGGMVSTPFEERARYMFALDQELSHSISRIAGVESARVHVVIPDQSPLERTRDVPRASVFVYHQPDAEIRKQVPVIKTLIVNSVNGLAYEDVAVALFPASAVPAATIERSSSRGETFGGFGIALACLAGLGVFAVIRRPGKEPSPRRAAGASER